MFVNYLLGLLDPHGEIRALADRAAASAAVTFCAAEYEREYPPAGARKIGCRGCRPREQSQGQRVYCATCPVTLRQQDGQPWVINWGGRLPRAASTDPTAQESPAN